MLTANPVSSVLASKSLLLPENKCRALLELIANDNETVIDDPKPGRFSFWAPNFSLAHLLGVLHKHGLPVQESMHLASRPFAKTPLPAGYLTVPLLPLRARHDGPFRKPNQLKQCETLATVTEIAMATLMMYLGEIEILNEGVWLVTADKVGDKHVCFMATESAIFVEPHDDTKVMHNNHACAVKYNC